MELSRNKLMTITMYIVSIIVYLPSSLVLYNMLLNVEYYYLLVLIPMFLLLCTLCFSTIIKTILTLTAIIFGRYDNNEIIIFIEQKIKGINKICRYIFIGLFISLLFAVMVLDIIYCINKEKYVFIAISIVIWILLFYCLFSIVLKIAKKTQK